MRSQCPRSDKQMSDLSPESGRGGDDVNAVGLANDGVNQVLRHEARQRADDLAFLAFPVGGFLAPLSRVAAGRMDEGNIDDLKHRLDDTSDEVQQRVLDLRRYDEVVRENCGMAAAQKYQALIDGPGGKYAIRYDIENLVLGFREGRTPEMIAEEARSVIDRIDGFNTALIELQDTIPPPRGAPQ